MSALLTLAAARLKLWKYGPPTNSYTDRTAADVVAFDVYINQVAERILGMMKPRHAMRRVNVPIYDGQITLPRHLQTMEGMQLLSDNGCACAPLQIYSRFHEFAHPIGNCCFDPAVWAVSQLAQTYITPAPVFYLRAMGSAVSATPLTLIGGYDEDNMEYFDSVTLAIALTDNTTTRSWNSMPQIQKPVTTGSVTLSAVDTVTGEETDISIYAPGETVPAYQRYRVPEINGFNYARIFGKLAYVEATADTDIIYPGVTGALKAGLQALNYEDNNDLARARNYWDQAFTILDNDNQQLEGDAAMPVFKVAGDFGAGSIAQVQ